MPTEFDLQEELRRCRESAERGGVMLIDPLCRLARWYCDQRQPQRARRLVEEIWMLHKQSFGETDQRTVGALSWLASLLASTGKPDRAEKLLSDLIARLRRDRVLPVSVRAVIWNQLVEVYYQQSRLSEALDTCHQAVALLTDRRLPRDVRNAPACLFQLSRARNNLGALHVSRGEYQQAQLAFRKNLRQVVRQHPDDVAVIAQLLSNLAVVARHRGLIEKSQRLTILAIRKCQRAVGNVHPLVAQGLSNLAIYRLQGGRPASALSLFRKALKIRLALYPRGHHQIRRSIQQIAEAHLVLGQFTVAQRLLERVRHGLERQEPVDELQLARTMCRLGYVYLQTNQMGSSLRAFEQARKTQEELLGSSNLQLIPTLNGLGEVDAARGNFESAQRFYLRSLTIAEQHLGLDHPDLVQMLILLGDVSLARGNLHQAQSMIDRARSIRESRLGTEHPLVAEPLVRCGRIALAENRPEQAMSIVTRAEQLLRQATECPPLDLADTLAVKAEAAGPLRRLNDLELWSLEELRLREQVVGTRHATLLPAIKRLASFYMESQFFERAAPLLQRGLAIAESSLRQRDEGCIYFSENMGRLLLAREEYEEANRWMERTIKMVQVRYGANADEVADTLLRFASSLRTARREPEAVTLELRAVDVRNRGQHVLL